TQEGRAFQVRPARNIRQGDCYRLFLINATHGRDVEATVHVENLTGNTRSQVGGEECAGVTDFLDGHVAAQRGAGLVVGQHLAEALDARGGQGTDRTGGNGIHTDAVFAQAVGQVAYTGFQTGLGHAHDVVV